MFLDTVFSACETIRTNRDLFFSDDRHTYHTFLNFYIEITSRIYVYAYVYMASKLGAVYKHGPSRKL